MNQQHYYLHTFRIGSFLLFSSFFELHFKTFKWENMSVYGEYQNDKFSRWILSQLVIPSLISSWALEMHNANPKIKGQAIPIYMRNKSLVIFLIVSWKQVQMFIHLVVSGSAPAPLLLLYPEEASVPLYCFYYTNISYEDIKLLLLYPEEAAVPLYCFYYINISY